MPSIREVVVRRFGGVSSSIQWEVVGFRRSGRSGSDFFIVVVVVVLID